MRALYGLYFYPPDEEQTNTLLGISYNISTLKMMMNDFRKQDDNADHYPKTGFNIKPVIIYHLHKITRIRPLSTDSQYVNLRINTHYQLDAIDASLIDTSKLIFYGANMSRNINVEGLSQTMIFDGIVFGKKDIITSYINDNPDVETSISINPLSLDTLYPEGVVNA